jgi:hypothetical protein
MIPGMRPIRLNEIRARIYLPQGTEDISVPTAIDEGYL